MPGPVYYITLRGGYIILVVFKTEKVAPEFNNPLLIIVFPVFHTSNKYNLSKGRDNPIGAVSR